MGRPMMGCRTLAIWDFILVLLPAAKTTTATSVFIVAIRIHLEKKWKVKLHFELLTLGIENYLVKYSLYMIIRCYQQFPCPNEKIRQMVTVPRSAFSKQLNELIHKVMEEGEIDHF